MDNFLEKCAKFCLKFGMGKTTLLTAALLNFVNQVTIFTNFELGNTNLKSVLL